jgi:hypothetical protein
MNFELTAIVGRRRLDWPIVHEDRHESGRHRMVRSADFSGYRLYGIPCDIQMDRQVTADERNTACLGNATIFLLPGIGPVVYDVRTNDRRRLKLKIEKRSEGLVRQPHAVVDQHRCLVMLAVNDDADDTWVEARDVACQLDSVSLFETRHGRCVYLQEPALAPP